MLTPCKFTIISIAKPIDECKKQGSFKTLTYRTKQSAKRKQEILKGNCNEKFLLQNIFGFHIYITNIYVKLSTETVITLKKNNFKDNSISC